MAQTYDLQQIRDKECKRVKKTGILFKIRRDNNHLEGNAKLTAIEVMVNMLLLATQEDLKYTSQIIKNLRC